uniref:Uncharacterized protein n=1 Tax=Romanomermis culicivorax TaxID=13658 RepID=A0A915JQC0_ROMCU
VLYQEACSATAQPQPSTSTPQQSSPKLLYSLVLPYNIGPQMQAIKKLDAKGYRLVVDFKFPPHHCWMILALCLGVKD